MLRILCVEDSEMTIEVLQAALGHYQLTFAGTVEAGLKLLEEQTFSLMLLDVGLPDGSGLELLAQLVGKAKNLPVICLTGKKDFGSKVSAFTPRFRRIRHFAILKSVRCKKNGSLNADEFAHMKQHAAITHDILDKIHLARKYRGVPLIASSHHEYLNGSGYPNGLKSNEIPFMAKGILWFS